jgi:hypothetical protein
MGVLKCTCGGIFAKSKDLDGLVCNRCNAFISGDTNKIENIDVSSSMADLYSEDRAKSMRGVPVEKYTLGSESKGRIEIIVPIYASEEERSLLIERGVATMERILSQVKDRELDIFSSRK